MRKRTIALLLAGIMVFGAAGCGQKAAETTAPAEPEPVVEEPAPVEEEEEIEVDEGEGLGAPDLEEEELEEEIQEADIDYPTLPLPAWEYTGPEDWADYGDSIGQFLLENSNGEYSEGDLGTCTPIILKVDESDPSDVKVWGEFWLDYFNLNKTTLSSVAGGSYGGLAHFDITNGSPLVTDFEPVQDGSDYDPSVKKIFGSVGLEEDYAKACDSRNEYRAAALSYYINANGLYITQFQDYGWPPIPIPNAPETRPEDQMVDFVSNLGYTTQYDMTEFCVMESDEDGDYFNSITSDDWNEVMVRVYSRTDKDLDGLIDELNTNTAEFDDWRDYDIEKGTSFANIEEGCVCMRTPDPYKDGERIHVIYLIPRDSDILVIDAGSEYTDSEEKQMMTDAIVEGLLGYMEIK